MSYGEEFKGHNDIKVTIELTVGQLSHLISLESNNINRRKRRYFRPQDVAHRQQYFNDPANIGKGDLADHLIKRSEMLVEVMKRARRRAVETATTNTR